MLFRTALSITSWLSFARLLDSNTPIRILLANRCILQQQHVDCKIADALLKKVTKQHADDWDAPGKAWTHMVLYLPHAEGGFGVTFLTMLRKTRLSILLLHGLWLGLVLSPRNVRACGCLRMILRTHPRGYRPRFCFSVTSTSSFSPSIIAKRRRLSRRSMLGLVVDSAPRTVSRSSRRLLASPFRSLTASLRLPLCGMRALPPMLLLLSSPHSLGSSNRYSVTGRPSGTSNLCLRDRVALNS